MTTPTGTFLGDVTEGFGRLLAADAPAVFSWQGTTPATTGIWPMKLPQDTARAVAVATYPLTSDAALSDVEIGVQFALRSAAADIRDLWALEQAVQASLLGRYPVVLPTGARVALLTHTSTAPAYQDDANRWLMTINHTALLDRQTPFRH